MPAGTVGPCGGAPQPTAWRPWNRSLACLRGALSGAGAGVPAAGGADLGSSDDRFLADADGVERLLVERRPVEHPLGAEPFQVAPVGGVEPVAPRRGEVVPLADDHVGVRVAGWGERTGARLDG